MTTSAPNAAVPTAALDGTKRCRRNEGVPRLPAPAPTTATAAAETASAAGAKP